ncbi:hypothetical protein [Thiolinea disciformis]|uniref:hypothetical protein n=1 Tax=Thiolinea disciformis TaxID=125614 RepID=UPI00036210F0|nr:hypothetical protein [Thiolinea disciformis]
MSTKTSQFSIICLVYLIGCSIALAEPNETQQPHYTPKPITAPQPTNNSSHLGSRPLPPQKPKVARQFMVRAGIPAQVYLEDTIVMVRAGNAQPVSLESIYWPLYQQWRNQYLRLGDFDRDGLMDIGVLQSVGHVGQDLCYAIYTYDQSRRQFRSERSFDRCNL